jgi:hypothetical protein
MRQARLSLAHTRHKLDRRWQIGLTIDPATAETAAASDNLPGFRALGISPRSLEEELEAMLKQSNKENQ